MPLGTVSRDTPGYQSQMDITGWWKQEASPGSLWQGSDEWLKGFHVVMLTALLGGSHITLSLETLINSLRTHFITPGGRSPHVGCSSIITQILSS